MSLYNKHACLDTQQRLQRFYNTPIGVIPDTPHPPARKQSAWRALQQIVSWTAYILVNMFLCRRSIMAEIGTKHLVGNIDVLLFSSVCVRSATTNQNHHTWQPTNTQYAGTFAVALAQCCERTKRVESACPTQCSLYQDAFEATQSLCPAMPIWVGGKRPSATERSSSEQLRYLSGVRPWIAHGQLRRPKSPDNYVASPLLRWWHRTGLPWLFSQ